jgi:hypothetical protein
MNFTIHNAISGITSNLVYSISHAETVFDNVEDKRRHIQSTLDWLNKDQETNMYEMFEINKCLLIYHGLTHTITIKFEL